MSVGSESIANHNGAKMSKKSRTIPSARYADFDDSLTAAAAEMERDWHMRRGSVTAAWAGGPHDRTREEIRLTYRR